jgi:hypothetical protein
MQTLEEAFAAIKPHETIDYYDRIHIRAEALLTLQHMQRLDRECGALIIEPPWSRKNPLPTYWLQLCQPSYVALQLVARLGDDAVVNYAEITRDQIFAKLVEAATLVDFHRDHFVQSRHGTRGVQSYSVGFSTRRRLREGERRTGRAFNCYGDKPSRMINVGEPCFHFEGKHCGRRDVGRLGINHPRDLLKFDFAAYFARHITFYQIDIERLGRFHLNKRSGSKRQKPRIHICGSTGYVSNVDAAVGSVLYQHYAFHEDGSRSLQRFIDCYGKGRKGPYLQRLHYYDDGAQRIMLSEVPAAQAHLSFSLPPDAPLSTHNSVATDLPSIRPRTSRPRIRLDDIDVQVPNTASDLPPSPNIEPQPRTSRSRIPPDDPSDLIQPRPRTRLPNAAA